MNLIAAKHLWGALGAGLILGLHLYLLLRTGKAATGPYAKGQIACCGDTRENSIREMTVFGGASALDWGLLYWLIAGFSKGLVADIALAYALMRSASSLVQTIGFLTQAKRVGGSGTFVLKAHLDGCGYTTAASPFWWLYWLGEIPGWGRPIIWLRDLITRIDYLVSLPGIGLLNLMGMMLGLQSIRPRIGRTGQI